MDIIKFVLGVFVIVTITACSAAGSGFMTDTPLPSPQNSIATSLESDSELDSLIVNTAEPTLSSSESGTLIATIKEDNQGIWVKILEPVDNAVLTTPEIILRGEASPDTIISINDEIVYIEAGKEPSFSIKLALEEGENIIEVFASNFNEEEVYLVLTVFYEPPEL